MHIRTQRFARIRAAIALPMLLGLACSLSADSRSPQPAVIELLRSTGICPARGECAATPEQMQKLREVAKTTEQEKPVPVEVVPGVAAGAAPSDAIVLFDGGSLKEWVSVQDRSPARWPVRNGVLTVDKALGNIETRRHFGSYQLHIEWLIPEGITGAGQGRGNSGLFLAATAPGDAGYELQILDSWNNSTYVNGQAASVYKQAPPLVNASRKPGEWQIYDVIWTAPTFATDGSLASPAYVTLLHNGVLVQNHVRLAGETVFVGKPSYRAYRRAPVRLQAHADPSAPISFRNIWLRELGRQPLDSK